jgi:hypothetical protein
MWLTYGYDVDAVDWFLDQLLLRSGPAQLPAMSADPWRDLGVVAQFARSDISDIAERTAKQARQAIREHFSEDCSKAWDDFGQQPGVSLRWGYVATKRCELHTVDMRTVACMKSLGQSITVSAGGRSLAVKKPGTARSSFPGIAEIIARSSRDSDGHFAAKKTVIVNPDLPDTRLVTG